MSLPTDIINIPGAERVKDSHGAAALRAAIMRPSIPVSLISVPGVVSTNTVRACEYTLE